ncbi:MAG: CAP domain-containing protein, partial [Longimicrobiales bacterium]
PAGSLHGCTRKRAGQVRKGVPLACLLVVAGCQLPLGRSSGPIAMPDPRVPPADTDVDIHALERELFHAVNGARGDEGARALDANSAMARAAREHALELAARHELDHRSIQAGRETFADRLALAGAPAWTLAGENLIQLPFVTRDVPGEAVRGWLGSASHRMQMLEPSYTDTGVGIARDAHGDWFIVQLFVRRR